jgi:hypothetical protein
MTAYRCLNVRYLLLNSEGAVVGDGTCQWQYDNPVTPPSTTDQYGELAKAIGVEMHTRGEALDMRVVVTSATGVPS